MYTSISEENDQHMAVKEDDESNLTDSENNFFEQNNEF